MLRISKYNEIGFKIQALQENDLYKTNPLTLRHFMRYVTSQNEHTTCPLFIKANSVAIIEKNQVFFFCNQN